MNSDGWEEILRSAHAEPIDPAHYTAVRARVMAEIRRGRDPWRWLAWISGIAVAIAAAVFAAYPRRPELPLLRPVAIAIPPAPEAPRVRPEPVRLMARARPRSRHKPLTIKLQTSDPNIVIYWIAD